MNVTSTTKMDDAHRLVEVFTDSNTISSTQLKSEGDAVEIWNKIPWALIYDIYLQIHLFWFRPKTISTFEI